MLQAAMSSAAQKAPSRTGFAGSASWRTCVQALRVSLIQEELDEYRAAAEAGDLVGIADALSDLMYVVLGTYVAHGLQDPAEELFAEVQRSNMSKLDENGQPIFRADGKVLKSKLFSQPDLQSILAKYPPGGNGKEPPAA